MKTQLSHGIKKFDYIWARPFEKQHVESCPFDKAVAIWEELYTLGLASLLKTKYNFFFRFNKVVSTNNSRLQPTPTPSLIQHWPSILRMLQMLYSRWKQNLFVNLSDSTCRSRSLFKGPSQNVSAMSSPVKWGTRVAYVQWKRDSCAAKANISGWRPYVAKCEQVIRAYRTIFYMGFETGPPVVNMFMTYTCILTSLDCCHRARLPGIPINSVIIIVCRPESLSCAKSNARATVSRSKVAKKS